MQRDEKEQQDIDASGAGLIVEDTTVVGGIDKVTGQPVIRAKTTEGKADKLTEATDPSERQ